MKLSTYRTAAVLSAVFFWSWIFWSWMGAAHTAHAQTSDSNVPQSGSSSSSPQSGSSSSSSAHSVEYAQEKTPTVLDPAGPTISLITSEPVFYMAAALNACGYDEGLDESDPIRKWVRQQMDQALAQSADAREKRDKLCLYVAQHRMTGTDEDIAQYISLALYMTQPPGFELTAEMTDLPPDATQVVGAVPLVKDFAEAVDLNGIWLAAHHEYDREENLLHDPLSQMIVNTNLYLHMPAESYAGRRFLVIIEPMLSPHLVNARIYGADYVAVVSPVNGAIPMHDVRHTYLHYVIDPLLYARYNGLQQMDPVLKAIRDAPLDFHYKNDPTLLTTECLIKAIEARTMDTGIPVYKIPAGVERSQLPRYQRQLQIYQQKVDAAKWAAVEHDMVQGFVLTQYFYEQLLQFEKSPDNLNQDIGEMVYGMDVVQQVSRAKHITFDTVADTDVLMQNEPRKLTGLDLAEAKLSEGDAKAASAIANKAIADETSTPASVAAAARADFILARAALMTGHPQQGFDDFQKTVATGQDPRIVAWSHIYMGRMLDLECKRGEALLQYKAAMAARDGRLDTRLAAERGEKTAYAVNGHSCQEDADAPDAGAPDKPTAGSVAAPKPQ